MEAEVMLQDGSWRETADWQGQNNHGEEGSRLWFGMSSYTFTEGLPHNLSFDLEFWWTEWREEYIFRNGKKIKKIAKRRIWSAEY